jgi:Xaa-Pro dipeptidase
MKTGFDLSEARKLMEEKEVECVVATSRDNVYYASGSDIMTINLIKRLAATFIPLDGDPVFGVHANEEVTARESTWINDLRVYEGGEWEPLKPIEFIAETLKEKGFTNRKIGLELMDIPGMSYDHLKKLLPKASFQDAQPIFDKLRSVKSPEEIKQLSEANLATTKAITIAYQIAREGDTERAIANNMVELALDYGAERVAFMTLGAGKNVFELHHVPTDYKIRKGDLIHVDFGCYFKGYMSDISRTAVVGEPTNAQRKAYDTVIEAERVAAEALREGVRVIDVHETVKSFYESKGHSYDRAFIGHGIGIGCHEAPFLGPSHGDWTLEDQMFFQIEPSITIGDIRIHTEDSFIVSIGRSEIASEYLDISELQIIK